MSSQQLRWQCRRGMRELDVLLSRYLERRYAAADAAEKASFEQLLALPDPELAAYLLRSNACPDASFAAVIERIHGAART